MPPDHAAAAPAGAQPDTATGTAIPDDPGILKRRAAPPPEPLQASAEVRVRLSPDLGERTDAVRAAVLASGSARIAEPAEVELRTRRNFPLTLQRVNAWEPEALWQMDLADDPAMPVRAPRTVELGNLELADYAVPLREALDRIGRANALLASSTANGKSPTVTCFAPASPTPVVPTCDAPVQSRAPADAPPAPLESDRPARFAVGNRSKKPQYVALFIVDSDKVITRIPLQGGEPLAPGAWAQDAGPTTIHNRGAYWLVTVASGQPFAGDPVDAALAANRNVAVSASRHDLYATPIEPIGGGIDVPQFAAPWMAEFYSTVPYTEAELAADDALPEGEREYLRKRSAVELAHRCGGTLIAPDLVLTAAHCVAKGNFAGNDAIKVLKTRRVRLGSLGLGSGGVTYAIDAMAVHGGYDPERKQPQSEHDIALLRLRPDRDSTWAAGSPIARVAGRAGATPMPAGSPVAAYGWGYTGEVEPGEDPLRNIRGELQHNPGTLQMGELQAMDWGDCQKLLGTDLGRRMLCAVSRVDPRTGRAPRHVFSCRGDSGGPLVRQVEGQDVLVGIASWSRGCGYRDFPSVYTNVSRYAAWLEAAIRQLESGKVVRVNEQPAARAAAD